MNRFPAPHTVMLLFAVALFGVCLAPNPATATEAVDGWNDPNTQIIEHRDSIVASAPGVPRNDDEGNPNDDDGGWTADPDWFQIDSRSGQDLELVPETERQVRWNRFLNLMRVILSNNVFGPGL